MLSIELYIYHHVVFTVASKGRYSSILQIQKLMFRVHGRIRISNYSLFCEVCVLLECLPSVKAFSTLRALKIPRT